jgi:hypothetical protein
MPNLSAPPQQAALVDKLLNVLQPWRMWFSGLFTWLNSLSFQNVTVDFGGTPTMTATLTLTNQPWVTAQSKIVANALCPVGVAPATFNALGMKTIVSGIAAGTFTITLTTTSNTTGQYTVSVVGSS